MSALREAMSASDKFSMCREHTHVYAWVGCCECDVCLLSVCACALYSLKKVGSKFTIFFFNV